MHHLPKLSLLRLLDAAASALLLRSYYCVLSEHLSADDNSSRTRLSAAPADRCNWHANSQDRVKLRKLAEKERKENRERAMKALEEEEAERMKNPSPSGGALRPRFFDPAEKRHPQPPNRHRYNKGACELPEPPAQVYFHLSYLHAHARMHDTRSSPETPTPPLHAPSAPLRRRLRRRRRPRGERRERARLHALQREAHRGVQAGC